MAQPLLYLHIIEVGAVMTGLKRFQTALLLISLTTVVPNVALAQGPSCEMVFLEETSQWPPASFPDYLRSLPQPNTTDKFPTEVFFPRFMDEPINRSEASAKPLMLSQKSVLVSEDVLPIDSFLGFARYRALRRRLEKSDGLFVQTIETIPLRYKPEILNKKMRDAGLIPSDFQQTNQQLAMLRSHPLVQKAWKINKELIDHGRSEQLQELIEILNFVLPKYIEIRHWSQEFIEKIFNEAVLTMDNTVYKVVRADEGGRPGAILGVIGLTKAPYGKVVYYNRKFREWEERFGPFGDAYIKDKVARDDSSEANRHLRAPIYWDDSAIPILSFEKNLGPYDSLNRPAVLERVVTDPYQEFSFVADRQKLKQAFDRYWVDTTKPIYYYSGQVLEPTKFAISKDRDLRNTTRQRVLFELFKSVYTDSDNVDLSMHGQQLYTYNDASGVRLYRSFGFEPIPNLSLHAAGSEWTVLQVSPQTFLERMSDPQFTGGLITQDLVQALMNQTAATSETPQ
jgi:hypothetical protein